jgi:hypothetical protein
MEIIENAPVASTEIIVDEPPKKAVSYSQFSNWMNCPHRWYLDFVKGLRIYDDNINTTFGTAIHEAIQTYIETLYKQGAKEADAIDLYDIFKNTFTKVLEEKKVKHTPEEFTEFCVDAENIILEFKNVTNRIKYFPTNKYEFVSVEDEIKLPIKHGINFIGYIDLVLKERQSGRYKIIDIKTSAVGWNSYMKDNPSKTAQILLYKAFFSKKYNVPVEMIDVEFFILKRKLYENYAFPQSRIQTFIPPHNQKNVIQVLNTFSKFIVECFHKDGTFIEDLKNYPKIPGKSKKNCKYCPHKKLNCDAKADVIEDD